MHATRRWCTVSPCHLGAYARARASWGLQKEEPMKSLTRVGLKGVIGPTQCRTSPHPGPPLPPTLCGARTRRGTQCAMSRIPGRGRCRLHGGASTGPRTAEGKAKVTLNLRSRRPIVTRQ